MFDTATLTLAQLQDHYKQVRARLDKTPPRLAPVVVRPPLPPAPPVVKIEIPPPPMTRSEIILAQVAEKHGLTVRDLVRYGAKKKIATARHEATYRLRNELGLTLTQISFRLGGRDHTTILASIRKHEKNLAKSLEANDEEVITTEGCHRERNATNEPSMDALV